MAGRCQGIPRGWLWVGAIGHLAEACAGPGDTHHAPVLVDLLRPYAQRNLVLANGALRTGAAARNLGLLLTILGEFDDAESCFRTAIDLNTRFNARPWLAGTQLGYADLPRTRAVRRTGRMATGCGHRPGRREPRRNPGPAQS